MTRGPQDRAGCLLLGALLCLLCLLAGATLGSWHDLGMIR